MQLLSTCFLNSTPFRFLFPLQLHSTLIKVNHNLHGGQSNGQFSAPPLLHPSPVFYTVNYFLVQEALAKLGKKGRFFSNITSHTLFQSSLMAPSLSLLTFYIISSSHMAVSTIYAVDSQLHVSSLEIYSEFLIQHCQLAGKQQQHLNMSHMQFPIQQIIIIFNSFLWLKKIIDVSAFHSLILHLPSISCASVFKI